MKTLQEINDLISDINDEAYGEAYEYWIQADQENDEEIKEELLEDASSLQSVCFRDLFFDLDISNKDSVLYWLKNDEDFLSQFRDWFGHDHFDEDEIFK